MPWTLKQIRYLLSSGSPLAKGQKEKMKAELHAGGKTMIRKKKNPNGYSLSDLAARSAIFAAALLACAALRAEPLKRHDCGKSAVSVKMQDGNDKHSQWYQCFDIPHRTMDRSFWILNGLAEALTVADTENTMRYLGRPGGYEMNPIYGRHPGRLRYYTIGEGLWAVSFWESWYLKRQDDALRAYGYKPPQPRWWIAPLITVGTHGVGMGITLYSWRGR